MRTIQAPSTALPLDAAPVGAPPATPDLMRLVLRRSLPALAGVLAMTLLACGLALQRDTAAEIDGALATARVSRYLGNLAALDDRQALAALRQHAELRHLSLRVTDGDNRTLLGNPPPVSAIERAVAWTVARPVGEPWTVTLAASPDSEHAEALRRALELLAVVSTGCAMLLGVVLWTLKRALAPLAPLAAALRQLQVPADTAPPATAESSPRPLPSAEIDALASATQGLAASMSQREAALRRQAQQAQRAHECEHQRMAGEMHDEFAQRLTALRLDITWLRRRLQGNDGLEPVIQGMLGQLGRLQQGLRSWVVQLHPLLPRRAVGDSGSAPERCLVSSPQRLRELLTDLVDATETGGGGLRVELYFEADTTHLPPALLLSVLRMTQEALSNVRHHAVASLATVTVCIDGRAGTLDWSVSDNGIGLPGSDIHSAMSRGDGLAWMRQRAWAHHGRLDLLAADALPAAAQGASTYGARGSYGSHGRRGLRLGARLSLDAS